MIITDFQSNTYTYAVYWCFFGTDRDRRWMKMLIRRDGKKIKLKKILINILKAY